MKEAIFSPWSTCSGLEGACVPDLFADPGALDSKVASRGARSVVLVEDNPNAIAAIEKNARAVGCPDVTVSPMKVSSYPADAPGEPSNRIIADPPYELAGEAATGMLEALRSFLTPDAAVTVEHCRDSDGTRWPGGYEQLQQKLRRRIHNMVHFDTATYNT